MSENIPGRFKKTLPLLERKHMRHSIPMIGTPWRIFISYQLFTSFTCSRFCSFSQ